MTIKHPDNFYHIDLDENYLAVFIHFGIKWRDFIFMAHKNYHHAPSIQILNYLLKAT